jgi:hypothetical protein
VIEWVIGMGQLVKWGKWKVNRRNRKVNRDKWKVSGELLKKGSLKAHILGYSWRKNDLSQSDDWLFGV